MRCDRWEDRARTGWAHENPEWLQVINGMSAAQMHSFVVFASGYLPAKTYTEILSYAVSQPRELV